MEIHSSEFSCERYEFPKRPALEGVLEVNDILTKSEYLLKDKILGPESIIVEGDSIITGTLDGMVVLIEHGAITSRFEMAKLEQCDGGFDKYSQCGRPLGLRRLDGETIIAIDGDLGIFSINFQKEIYAMELPIKTKVDGKPLKFLNDIEVVNNDVLLFTESSTEWDRRHLLNIFFEGIPNGRYWIAGPRTGETEIFVDNLPGFPDNIRSGSNGTFWVALAMVRHSGKPSWLDLLAEHPCLRNGFEELCQWRHLDWLHSTFGIKHAMIVQLNEEGKIIASAHDPEGKIIKEVSQVTETDEYLYLGSYHAPYIARLRKDLIVA